MTQNEYKDLAADFRLSIDKINAIKTKLEKAGFTVTISDDESLESIEGKLVGSVERQVTEKLL